VKLAFSDWTGCHVALECVAVVSVSCFSGDGSVVFCVRCSEMLVMVMGSLGKMV